MRILILEDDHEQHMWLKDKLGEYFPEASFQIITSELKFREHLDALAADPPNVAVFDMMVRWTTPAPDMILPPPDIREAGFFEAGLRCQRLLHDREETLHVPVIFYTILGKESVSPDLQRVSDRDGIMILQKAAEVKSLVGAIKVALAARDVREMPK